MPRYGQGSRGSKPGEPQGSELHGHRIPRLSRRVALRLDHCGVIPLVRGVYGAMAAEVQAELGGREAFVPLTRVRWGGLRRLINEVRTELLAEGLRHDDHERHPDAAALAGILKHLGRAGSRQVIKAALFVGEDRLCDPPGQVTEVERPISIRKNVLGGMVVLVAAGYQAPQIDPDARHHVGTTPSVPPFSSPRPRDLWINPDYLDPPDGE